MQTTEIPARKETVIFDYLRGLAIIFIVLYHFVLEYSRYRIRTVPGDFFTNWKAVAIFEGDSFGSLINNIITAIFSLGWEFVGVFLFLSGFGLTFSQLKKGDQSTSFFKRLGKLVPLWQISIVFAYFINLVGIRYFSDYLASRMSTDFQDYFRLLLFPLYVDFNFNFTSNVNPSLWFMVLIFQAYLFYELFYKAMQKLGAYKFLLLSLVITLLYRFIVIFYFSGSPTSVVEEGRAAHLMNLLPARWFEFSLGMVVATYWKEYRLFNKINLRFFLIGVVLFIIGNVANWSDVGWIFSDILLTIGLVCFCSYLLKLLGDGLLTKFLKITAWYSFIIYLIHNQIVTQIVIPLTFMVVEQSSLPNLVYLFGIVCTVMLIVVGSWLVLLLQRGVLFLSNLVN